MHACRAAHTQGCGAPPDGEERDVTASTIFLLLLVLACPLMVVLMMRGHGHGRGHSGHLGGRHGGRDGELEPREMSADELRRRRDALALLIEEREQDSERDLTSSA